MPRHAWAHPPEKTKHLLLSWLSSPVKNSTSCFKNPAFWLVQRILDYDSISRFFPNMSFLQKVRRPIAHSKKVHTYGFHFCQNAGTLIFRAFLVFFPFWPVPTFFKNQDPSLVLFYDSLTWCKKSEKTEELILRSCVANNRSSHRRCFVKKGVLRYFPKSTGKQLCQRLFN